MFKQSSAVCCTCIPLQWKLVSHTDDLILVTSALERVDQCSSVEQALLEVAIPEGHKFLLINQLSGLFFTGKGMSQFQLFAI